MGQVLGQRITGTARGSFRNQTAHHVSPAEDSQQISSHRVYEAQEVQSGPLGQRVGDQAVHHRSGSQFGPYQLDGRGFQLVEGV